jgi:hypothetical protein
VVRPSALALAREDTKLAVEVLKQIAGRGSTRANEIQWRVIARAMLKETRAFPLAGVSQGASDTYALDTCGDDAIAPTVGQ